MGVEIAFVGAGGIAGTHLESLGTIDRADVVAVCDVDAGRAREVAADHDAAAFADHETLFAEASFDALFVCVPPFAHGDPELLAADHGVDVLVEKPLALTSDRAHEIGDALDRAGVVTQVGHMNRYAEVVDRARELIGDRDIAAAHAHWIGGVPSTGWWGIKERSGGQIVEQATHVYDIVRYLVGEVDAVCGFGGQQVVRDAIDFDDATTVSMRHATGAVSHVLATSASPASTNGVELVGEGFRLELDLGRGVLSGTVDGETVTFDGDDGDRRFHREAAAFVAAVESGDPEGTRSPYGDALETFELTLAADEAVERGGVVAVDR